jgi:hypothetical protein
MKISNNNSKKIPFNQIMKRLSPISDSLNEKSGEILKKFENLNSQIQNYLTSEKELSMKELELQSKKRVRNL